MGNSASKRSISVINDNIRMQDSNDKGAAVSQEKQAGPQERVFRHPSKPLFASGIDQDVLDKELEAAIEPFKRKRPEPSAIILPPEHAILVECFKKNAKNGLACSKEVQNFVNVVNKPAISNSDR